MKKTVYTLILAVLLPVLFILSSFPGYAADAAPLGNMPVSSPINMGHTGTVNVESNIIGADVYIDGELYKQAAAPCEIKLKEGVHEIAVSCAGYDDYRKSVMIIRDETEYVSAVLNASIPQGTGVRTITVTKDDGGVNYPQYYKWEYYEKFIINGEPDWHWKDPERVPYCYDVLTQYGDADGVSLRAALTIVMNDTSYYDEENQIRWHYVIEFADKYKNQTYYLQNANIFLYGRGSGGSVGGDLPKDSDTYDMPSFDGSFTINGDIDRDGTADVTIDAYYNILRLYIMCSDAHVNGIIAGREFYPCIGKPFNQPRTYFNLKNISFTGCTFQRTSDGPGRYLLNNPSQIGKDAEEYGGYGAYDLDGLSVSNCSFIEDQCAFIVANGTNDYSRVKNLVVQANYIENGYIFIRNVDCHTWYMWGNMEGYGSYDGDWNSVGYCSYNILEDVIVSGNRSVYTDKAVTELRWNFDGTYGQVLQIGNSNLGGVNNTLRNVLVRCNSSTITQALIDAYDYNPDAAVSIENVAVGESGYGYDDHLEELSSMVSESGNVFDGLEIAYNNYRLNAVNIKAVGVLKGLRTGTGNLMSNVSIHDNVIESTVGLRIYGLEGASEYGTNPDGKLSGVSVKNNIVTALKKSAWSENSEIYDGGVQDASGISVYGSRVAIYEGEGSNYEERGQQQPLTYSMNVSGVAIEGNEINGFPNGISVIAAVCDRTHYVEDIGIENVRIINNRITTDNINKNCQRNGITVAGAENGGFRCGVKNIIVSQNAINALNGVAAAGFLLTTDYCRYGISGNYVENISVWGNTMDYHAPENAVPGYGIVSADVLSKWCALPETPQGDRVIISDIKNNTLTGFISDEPVIYSEMGGSMGFLSAEGLESEVRSLLKGIFSPYREDYNEYCFDVLWTTPEFAVPAEKGRYALAICCGIDRYRNDGTGSVRSMNYRPGNYHRLYICADVADVDDAIARKTASGLEVDFRLVIATGVYAAFYDISGRFIEAKHVTVSGSFLQVPEGCFEYKIFLLDGSFSPVFCKQYRTE